MLSLILVSQLLSVLIVSSLILAGYFISEILSASGKLHFVSRNLSPAAAVAARAYQADAAANASVETETRLAA